MGLTLDLECGAPSDIFLISNRALNLGDDMVVLSCQIDIHRGVAIADAFIRFVMLIILELASCE